MQPAASKKGISFQSDIDDDLPKACLLDRMRTQQILLNLLQNAIRYTNHGFVKLACRFVPSPQGSVDAEQDFGFLCISVSDSGIGISSENQKRIFQAFETIDEDPYKEAAASSSSDLGTSLGLGLSVVASLIDALGGKLNLESEVGKGTTIEVLLPTVCVAVKTRPLTTESVKSPRGASTQDRLVAFILDDAKPNRLLMKSYLKRLGFTCQSFSRAAKFLESCKNNPPDWVFIDWQLPGTKGSQLLNELYGMPRKIRVVVVTADVRASDEISQNARGVNACLFKPLEFKRFKQEMQRMGDFRNSSHPCGDSTVEVEENRSMEHGYGDLASLEKKIQRLVLEQFANDCEEMRQSISAGDRGRLQLIAHRVNGSAGNARLMKLASQMRQLEEAASTAEWETILQLVTLAETTKAV
jgi:CheY-like chemotaxis protein